MVWVKICGLQDLGTALFAARAGADALGFVFAQSRRQVTPDKARFIIRALPSSVMKIGVFVNEPLEQLKTIARFCRLDAVQLHGAEPPEYCRQAGWPVIKALRVGEKGWPERLSNYTVDTVLLDSYIPGCVGGTGKNFDWGTLKELKCAPRIILAGGLNPENVEEAIRIVRPYGVDVSSGVETGGRKDKRKISKFIKKVKGKEYGKEI